MGYCKHCGKELKGRSDKKFCDIQCKASYHNQSGNDYESYIRWVNKQLRRNRSVLRLACPMGKATVRISFLAENGLDFKYYTHTWSSATTNNTYIFCYDYGYLPIEGDKVVIIQQQGYMRE